MWINVGVQMVNAAKWSDLTDTGVTLYACHRIALAAAASKAAAAGRAPGQFSGILTSKGADGISAGFDASSVTYEGAGHYNLTTYGLQFREMANLFGMGPVQIGVDDGGSGSSIAWPGVIQPPF